MVRRLRNNNYIDAGGTAVYGFGFTCEELDYLDSRADSDARRARQDKEPADDVQPAGVPKKASRARSSRTGGEGLGAAAS